jgi:hypothetical protein
MNLYQLANDFTEQATNLADLGVCQCGCGKKTDIARVTLKKLGQVSGKPLRCIRGHRKNRPAPRPLIQRISESYIEDKETGCWNWQKKLDKKGYGRIRVKDTNSKDRMMLAHRASFEVHHGQIPSSTLVCHKCDNPRCVNPSHMFIGTHKDNSDDKINKGRDRHATGEENGISKINQKTVDEIRASALSLRQLASIYGLSYGHVGKIKRNEFWRKP